MDRRKLLKTGLALAASTALPTSSAFAAATCPPPSGDSFGHQSIAQGFVGARIGTPRSWQGLLDRIEPMSDYQQSWIATVLPGSIFNQFPIENDEARKFVGKVYRSSENTINNVFDNNVYQDVLGKEEAGRGKPSQSAIEDAVAAARTDPAISDEYRGIVLKGLELSSWNYITTNMALKQAELTENIAPEYAGALKDRILGKNGYGSLMDSVNKKLHCDGKIIPNFNNDEIKQKL